MRRKPFVERYAARSELIGMCEEVAGREAFARACDDAWATAAATGKSGSTKPDMSTESWNLLYDLHEWIAEIDSGDPGHFVANSLAFYALAPCFHTTWLFLHGYSGLPAEQRAEMWAGYRAALDDPDDRIADPMRYSLWVDFFEGADTVHDAWQGLALDLDPATPRTGRLLEDCGPVPWELKAGMIQGAMRTSALHASAFKALYGSAFDVYGQIDILAARALVEQLELPEETPGLEQLRSKLEAAKPGRGMAHRIVG